jgi:hypothetical protein
MVMAPPHESKARKTLLFLKKKKQKDFPPFAPAPDRAQVGKVFWFFFSKKNRFLRVT